MVGALVERLVLIDLLHLLENLGLLIKLVSVILVHVGLILDDVDLVHLLLEVKPALVLNFSSFKHRTLVVVVLVGGDWSFLAQAALADLDWCFLLLPYSCSPIESVRILVNGGSPDFFSSFGFSELPEIDLGHLYRRLVKVLIRLIDLHLLGLDHALWRLDSNTQLRVNCFLTVSVWTEDLLWLFGVLSLDNIHHLDLELSWLQDGDTCGLRLVERGVVLDFLFVGGILKVLVELIL